MANKSSLLTITTLLPIGAIAQAPTDSVAHEQTLQEVVVLAPTMERMDYYILVRPDANQRRHSGNAYELLQNCRCSMYSFKTSPVSLISKVVDADMELSDALAEATPQAITARYDLGYDTDYEYIKWAFTPNVMSLHLVYGGADHHIRIEFKNNYNYICAADELTQPNSFLSLAKTGVALQLKAIYDGSNLIQRFGAEEGNYMHIIFKAEL